MLLLNLSVVKLILSLIIVTVGVHLLSSGVGCLMYHQLGETVAKKKGMNLKNMTRLDTYEN